jgi:predicted enzyme related to lactoylglutathione lyase
VANEPAGGRDPAKPAGAVSEFSMLMALCRDLERSRDFYRNVMGLRVANDQVPHWVDFDLGGGKRLGLHPEGAGRKVTPGTLQLGFAVPNVDKFITDARVMGARILQEPFDAPFGRIAILSDPDGYAVQVFTPRS